MLKPTMGEEDISQQPSATATLPLGNVLFEHDRAYLRIDHKNNRLGGEYCLTGEASA